MAKAQLELKLARNVGDNKKSLFNYINSNRQYRNVISPFQDEDGHLTNWDKDKAGKFNAVFASVFNMDDRPRGSQSLELEDHDCENDQLPVDPEIVQDLLLPLDPYKSMGMYKIHPRILKSWLVIAKPLLMILEQSWESRNVPADWKLANIVPVFKKGKQNSGNYKPVSLTSVPGKLMKVILESIEKLLKETQSSVTARTAS
ncbi:hypothetical protein WISP_121091 [Willisornis vidua]|uniref:RNA-directed DNA polymerase from mobile element jockey n=1 Tax=Willisornis vidua TaxID=1566151 RepID=A0ABQ9CSI0_9PASS|nr:hypothetical protein WISP_121091 [Willisornis vidua]